MHSLTVVRPLHTLAGFLLLAAFVLPTSDTVRAEPAAQRVKVATTTSLYDTGLWDVLEAAFEATSGRELDIIYAGTGRALEWGARGDVDVVVTHSPTREAAFLAAGHGHERVPFAYNHFLIVGPASDPAGIGGCSPEEAFRRLHQQATHPFISRGDDSGTHDRERTIWKAAGLDPAKVRDTGRWYVEAGLGMGPTLSMTSQMGAYTLTDIGTFLAYCSNIDLVSTVAEGESLLNVYAVIVCARAANPDGAAALSVFLTSAAGQALIGDFGRETHGTNLFTPCAGRDCGTAATR